MQACKEEDKKSKLGLSLPLPGEAVPLSALMREEQGKERQNREKAEGCQSEGREGRARVRNLIDLTQ